ncbi:unnamed protein product [Rotaria sp. Silwood2]|nr:unnamed protein product [Rotaria sp. Silwood2]CAF3340358.1 unnamed protein product [Rotaria sp. Silwood2]CAF4081482.1 unnamed protein product [Rotaria sp. Silwood2]CAF4195824.1 unnamed protein product [Rotaria sp. Silwood2]
MKFLLFIGGQGGYVLVRVKRHLTLRNVYEKKSLANRYIAFDDEHAYKTCINAKADEINDIDDECIVTHNGDDEICTTYFQGQPDEATMINFDLKLLADVGLARKKV